METTTVEALATPHDMAKIYGVHVETVYRLLNKGEIPGAFKAGGSWRVSMPVWRAAVERVPADA